MEVKLREVDHILVASVSGRLDTLSAPSFQKELEKQIEQGAKRIVFDFSDLEYVSSAGLRSILIIAKKAKSAEGELVCCRLRGLVRKVFEISKFSEIVPTFESLDGALK